MLLFFNKLVFNMSSPNPEIDHTETDEDDEVVDENVGKVVGC